MFASDNYYNYFKNYKIVTTSRNKLLKSGGKVYSIYKTDFKLLNLIQAYKKDSLNKFKENFSHWEFTKFNYNAQNIEEVHKCIDTQKKVFVYDLNHAYLTILKEFNLISNDNYEKINYFYEVDKTKVMQIIGSVATRKKIETFENRIKVDEDIKQDKEGVLLWNFLEYQVNKKILEFINKNPHNKVLYYWFDEVCFLNQIKNYKSFGYKEKICIIKNKQVIDTKTGDIKDFAFLL